MHWTGVAVAVACLATLHACGPRLGVRAERSTIATFGRYDTYAWSSPPAPARSPQETAASIVDWRIRTAVDRGLAAKGYVRTEGAASLLVDTRVDAQGTLFLLLIDARTQRLAYRASAAGAVDESGDGRRVAEAIDRMLADLPRVMAAAGR